MQKLENTQISEILRRVQSQGVRYYDLQLEIVDHIASSIERQIEEGTEVPFLQLLHQEMKNWSSRKMKSLVKQKRKSLKSYWSKRAWFFILGYFKWPKVLLLTSLYFLLYLILAQAQYFDLALRAFTGILIVTSIVAILYLQYFQYAESHSHPPPLLVREAYGQTILGVYSGFYLLYFALDNFDSLGEQVWDIPILALLMAVYLFSIHAFIFVFPKWLKEDTLAQYQHLDIV